MPFQSCIVFLFRYENAIEIALNRKLPSPITLTAKKKNNYCLLIFHDFWKHYSSEMTQYSTRRVEELRSNHLRHHSKDPDLTKSLILFKISCELEKNFTKKIHFYFSAMS
ncbi:hypothetical protein BpHYR1_030993 [Brachionus plicatilis]|uniref:Uncharacterized protein n=1 Tax=Brachionus plicatilis TaxID=10195 RepID=A0A3M7T6R8_BRAPC|nr:hypothetical protein BpHYR1_030993 [Brachionus plicatilis]